MMGKIIGIGFVGLTQVFLWGILTSVLYPEVSSSLEAALRLKMS